MDTFITAHEFGTTVRAVPSSGLYFHMSWAENATFIVRRNLAANFLPICLSMESAPEWAMFRYHFLMQTDKTFHLTTISSLDIYGGEGKVQTSYCPATATAQVSREGIIDFQGDYGRNRMLSGGCGVYLHESFSKFSSCTNKTGKRLIIKYWTFTTQHR